MAKARSGAEVARRPFLRQVTEGRQAAARLLKRTARRLVHEAVGRSGMIEREIARCRRDLVLMYHAVETRRSGYPYSVSPRSLEKQIRFLHRHFEIAPLADLFARPAVASRVAFTFDDAYEDFYLNAYPLLRRYRVPATVFVPTAYIGEPGGARHDQVFGCAKRHLTWDQIREMRASGLVSFECHSHRHHSAVANIATLRQDVLTATETMERHIGYRPRYFAYPYGACNAQTHAILLACGFDKLLTVEPRVVSDQPTVGRFDVSRHNEQLADFKMTVSGLSVRSWLSQAWPARPSARPSEQAAKPVHASPT